MTVKNDANLRGKNNKKGCARRTPPEQKANTKLVNSVYL